MAENNNSNMSNDLQMAANTAKTAAKAAVSAGKAVAKAASGNVVGAVVGVLKDKTLRNILLGIVAFALCLLLLIFYALPSFILAAAQDIVNNIDEEIMEEIDSSGNSTLQFFLEIAYLSDQIGGRVQTMVWTSLKNFIVSLFTGEKSVSKEIYEGFIYDTSFDEQAAKDTLIVQMDKMKSRFDKRRDQYQTMLNKMPGYFSQRKNWPAGVVADADELAVTTNFDAPEVTEYDILQYMSAYSIQRGNGMEDISLRSLLAWTGFYNGGGAQKDTYTVEGHTFKTYDWKGDWVPQYQYEQWLQQDAAGITRTDFDTDDFLSQVYYVNKSSGITVTYPEPTRETRYYTVVDAETGEEELIPYEYVIAYMDITMTITKESTEVIEDSIMGFWEGDLSQRDESGLNRSGDPELLCYSWVGEHYIIYPYTAPVLVSKTYYRQSGYQTKYFEDLQETTAKYIGVSITNTENVDHTIVGTQTAESDNAERVVSIAESQLGTVGGSPYWNYGNAGDDWCAFFVWWCFEEARLVGQVRAVTTGGCTPMWRRFGGVANEVTGYYRGGSSESGYTVLVDDTTLLGGDWVPERGDLVFFKSVDKSNNYVVHVGIVEYYDVATNDLVTIEGNTSAGNYISPYSSQVLNKHRTTTQKYGTNYKSYNIIGFTRPNY